MFSLWSIYISIACIFVEKTQNIQRWIPPAQQILRWLAGQTSPFNLEKNSAESTKFQSAGNFLRFMINQRCLLELWNTLFSECSQKGKILSLGRTASVELRKINKSSKQIPSQHEKQSYENETRWTKTSQKFSSVEPYGQVKHSCWVTQQYPFTSCCNVT